jgi:hypothetical protein
MHIQAARTSEGRENGEDIHQLERAYRSDRRLVPANLIPNRSKKRIRLIKFLIVSIWSLEIIANSLNDYLHNSDQSHISIRQDQLPLIGNLLQVVVLVAANNEAYAEATADSPAVDALEDDDEDDEELDASASNEYPDGENDNDESYEDGDGKYRLD